MPSPPDDHPWDGEWQDAATVLEAQPHGLIADDTPPRPIQLLAGYEAGRADLRAVLIAGKNDPAFVETCTTLLARRARVPWPPES